MTNDLKWDDAVAAIDEQELKARKTALESILDKLNVTGATVCSDESNLTAKFSEEKQAQAFCKQLKQELEDNSITFDSTHIYVDSTHVGSTELTNVNILAWEFGAVIQLNEKLSFKKSKGFTHT